MKNREKYEKEIMNVACNGDSIAVMKKSGRVVSCNGTSCCLCLFRGDGCKEKIRDWTESEYIEQPKISKRDRAFLDYLKEEYKFITRDKNGMLFVYEAQPRKLEKYWYLSNCGCLGLNRCLNVDFPMIKWSDDEPWKIEDLKDLEVCEKYGEDI